MAGEINFNLLDPSGPAKIGNAFYQGQQELQQQQAAQMQNKLMQLSLADHQAAADRQHRLISLMGGLGAGATDDQRINALTGGGFFEEADKLRNGMLTRQKTEAEVNNSNFDLATKKKHQAIADIASLPNAEAALAGLDAHLKNGDIDQAKYDAVKATLPADPAKFGDWKLGMIKGILTPQEQVSANLNEAKFTEEKRQHRVQESQKAAELKKDYAVAGINPDGTPSADVAATVKGIGEYRIQPPTGMALRNPRMLSIMNQVQQQYPKFDATQYETRKKAARDFGTGPVGMNVQAQNTALNHLDTIEQLAAAQKNGDMQLFNKIANSWATATGNPAPTNLKAAVTMVAPEITKAVVGTAGGVHDRSESAATLNPDSSPDQMLGSIATIKELLGGRLAENERTYKRTTKLDDFSDQFLSPAAQKILGAKKQTAAPVQISSDADYAKLPSGAEFIAPDGSHRRKP